MPTYEYECTRCGSVVELFQSITEPARRKLKKNDPHACDCGAPVRRRIGTGAGIIFKGSGFYQTDYRSESYKNAAKAEKDSASGKDKPDAGAGGKDKTDKGSTKSETAGGSESKPSRKKSGDSPPSAKSKTQTAAPSS